MNFNLSIEQLLCADGIKIPHLHKALALGGHFNHAMRRYIIAFLITLLTRFDLAAQNISTKHADVTRRVKTINSDRSLQKFVLTNQQFMPQLTDGGGELVGYYKYNQIQKVTRSIIFSYGIETFDYYFGKGQLIFIYETLQGFIVNDSLGTVDNSKTELNFIGRYYFKNNKLVDSETTGHNRFERDEIDMEKTLLSESKENLAILIIKRRNVL